MNKLKGRRLSHGLICVILSIIVCVTMIAVSVGGVFSSTASAEEINSSVDSDTTVDGSEESEPSEDLETEIKSEVVDSEDVQSEDEDSAISLQSNNEANIMTLSNDNALTRVTPENGWYTISSSVNSTYVLDVASGKAGNDVNVQIYQSNGTAAQKFYFQNVGNNLYKIKTGTGNGDVLDIKNNKTVNGTNVQQYAYDGTNGQKWAIYQTSDGSYVIKSALSGADICLDIQDAKYANAVNVQMWTYSGNPNQKWKIEKTSSPIPLEDLEETSVSDGWYTISSKANSSYVLDISGGSENNGANLQIYQSNGTNAQKFYIEYDGTEYYTIKTGATDTKSSLDVAGGNFANGGNVQQWANNSNPQQKWKIYKASDGSYVFLTSSGNKCIDVSEGKIASGQNVHIWDYCGNSNQKWNLTQTEGAAPYAGLTRINVETGWYTISSKANSSYVLDISGGSENNGANLQIYQSNGTNAQKFYIEYDGTEYYTIKTGATDTKSSLDVAGGNFANGGNVQQWANNSNPQQKWKIYKASDGSYVFLTSSGNKCIDVSEGKIASGQNVHIWDYCGNSNQKWNLTQTEEAAPYKGLTRADVSDGWYTIHSKANTSYALDVANASATNGANIQLWNFNDTAAQKFYIKSEGDNLYTISTGLSGRFSLDVADGNFANGTNLQQWGNNGTAAQKWKIYKTSDGSYIFLTSSGNKCIDVSEGKMASGQNVHIWDYYGNNNQKWTLNATTPINNGDNISGFWNIRNLSNQNYDIAVSAAKTEDKASLVTTTVLDSKNEQKYELKKDSDGSYYIVAVHSDKVLEANGYSIYQNTKNGSTTQKWGIIVNSDNSVSFKNKSSNKYISVSGNITEGRSVTMADSNSSDLTKFVMTTTDYARVISDGAYSIVSALNSGYVMDVQNCSDNNGTKVQMWSSNGTAAQLFKIEYVGNGEYAIKTGSSIYKSGFDISGKSGTKGTGIIQYSYGAATNQKFKIIKTSSGNYVFKAIIGDNLALDIANENLNGGAIQLNTYTDSDKSEQFTLKKSSAWLIRNSRKYYFNESGAQPEIGIDISHHQADIDWEKVKADGISFAIIRVSDSIYTDDRKLQRNLSECERLGIPYGVYMYSRATTYEMCDQEATKLMNAVKGHNPTLGVYTDIEETAAYTDALGVSDLYGSTARQFVTNMASRILSKMQEINKNENRGLQVGLYANETYFNNILYKDQLQGYLWMARYYTNTSSDTNVLSDSQRSNYKYWQYTSTGSVNGISGNVDMNTKLW